MPFREGARLLDWLSRQRMRAERHIQESTSLSLCTECMLITCPSDYPSHCHSVAFNVCVPMFLCVPLSVWLLLKLSHTMCFRNTTMVGKQAGCRIKSYSNQPGFVKNISWEDITTTSTDKCITVNDEYKPTPKGAKAFIKVSA